MLSKVQKKKLIEILHDDVGKKDATTSLLVQEPAIALIKAGEPCVVSGMEESVFLLENQGAKARVFVKDGQAAKKNQLILQAVGPNKGILETERTVLNVLGRMSGVATQCKKATRIAGKKTKIFLTRKTMPGFNEFDKKACMHGGAFSHRKNLEEMILIKDNHLEFESIKSLLQKARKAKNMTKSRKVEIEVENTKQAVIAAENGADIIMLDNFSPANAKKTINEIKKINKKIIVELSGGISLNNLKKYTSLGAAIISMGSLTKDAKMIDFSMSIKKAGK